MAALAAVVRDAAAAMQSEGAPVRYVRSTIGPADEALLTLLEAASEQDVRAVYARAEVPFERLAPVLVEDGLGWIGS